jgi:hypothetical protein
MKQEKKELLITAYYWHKYVLRVINHTNKQNKNLIKLSLSFYKKTITSILMGKFSKDDFDDFNLELIKFLDENAMSVVFISNIYKKFIKKFDNFYPRQTKNNKEYLEDILKDLSMPKENLN